MIFNARYGRALARIEANLTQADPALAAKFERFNTLASRTPHAGKGARLRTSVRKLLALVLLPLAAAVALWMVATASGSRASARACATPISAACPASRAACHPADTVAGNRLARTREAPAGLISVGGAWAGAGSACPTHAQGR
jgi:Protein of unknown function (DUF3040)